jgi:hypothetical protein
MAAKAEKTEFIDNTARRKWDKEECAFPLDCALSHFHNLCATITQAVHRYERRAKERAERDEAAVIEVVMFPCSVVYQPVPYISISGQEF